MIVVCFVCLMFVRFFMSLFACLLIVVWRWLFVFSFSFACFFMYLLVRLLFVARLLSCVVCCLLCVVCCLVSFVRLHPSFFASLFVVCCSFFVV